ncbi:winged helix-turn-helix transcriptional regulator [Actinopolymorpha pittospori]|uniref:DNA-binding HxlR family transcriptional regulator n=1 Tax=Actinopolymorpha pittospori TaxID=648752 RepID=A0A927RJX8_9ACTN|nr:helix-turn-helix domain-containing protein [Actinopolymorpha pittospori]MBE1606138.1 DNA-binding HxlR family transcriptional regulator [Actinopolymorpha pittospori]
MALGKDYDGQDCSLARALELVGERWTLLVLRDAFYGVRRYSDFLEHLGAPRAVLAERLQALVDAGVLDKVRYQDSPARYEYVLTEAGQELWPALNALAWWGSRHRPTGGARRGYYHVTCGSRIDATTTCPTCGHAVPATEVEARVGSGTLDNRISRALRKPHRLLEPLAIE